MPSAHQPVNTPPELDRRVPLAGEREVPVVRADVVGDILALMLIVFGTTAIAWGVGTWVHPGAGAAAAGIVAVVVGVLLGNRSE